MANDCYQHTQPWLDKAQGDELTLLERLRQKISIESSGRSRYALAIARAAADLTAAPMASVPQPSIPVDSSLAVTEDVVHESWHDERAWQARRLEECLLGHA